MTLTHSPLLTATTLAACLLLAYPAASAQRVRLDRLPPPQARLSTASAALPLQLGLGPGSSLRRLSSHTDARGQRYERFEQVHDGVPVFGEHIIVVTGPDGVQRLSGTAVRGLTADVATIVPRITRDAALAQVAGRSAADNVSPSAKTRLVIHAGDTGPARLAWLVDSFSEGNGIAPSRPMTLVDAATGRVLRRWEGLTTDRIGTGPGGNIKVGQRAYGATEPYLDVVVRGATCEMETPDVITLNMKNRTQAASVHRFACPNNSIKPVNGAYAPLNDAHHGGEVVFDMYRQWLGVAPLPFPLVLRVHYGRNYENAFWNGTTMTFGDGDAQFHPLVSLDVLSHEVSHGFTERTSNLIYEGQSGGMNESFSDIAGEAAEVFAGGQSDFLVGNEVVKHIDALRYFDDPTRDGVSIKHASQFRPGMDPHLSSGVYNHAFYVLSHTPGWDVRKAFTVFATANRNYWTPSSTFDSGVCGMQSAATDLGEPVADVTAAFAEVGARCDI